MPQQTFRLFVSSPGDVTDERDRVDIVVEWLNAVFRGRMRIDVLRWENHYYLAHETFQKQLPEAAACDIVVAIFRGKLGTELPNDFPKQPSGESYPSGTAYEVLSSIRARQAGKMLPDIFVFRFPRPPKIDLDDPEELRIKGQWERLKTFFDNWFKTPSGQFLAAFHEFVSTDDFAKQLDDCLRQWLAKRGIVVQGPVWDRILDGSPFPGLEPFDTRYERVFFGRELATEHAVARLREAGARGTPFILLIGASGAGKSSFLRAGILPRLTRPGTVPEIDHWRQALVVSGSKPLLLLAEALFADGALGKELQRGDFRTAPALAELLAGDSDTAMAPIRAALQRAAAARAEAAHFDAPKPARLALAVDQAERLFVETDATAAAAFASVLAALVRHGLAYVVVTLRSDAYARFQLIDSFRDMRETGATFDLVPPAAAEIEEIINRPVAACHPPLAFETKGTRSLAAVLVEDAKGGDALPLLQMTLSRLFAAEAKRGDGLLRFADYPGLADAVTKAAEDAMQNLGAKARAEVPALITALVRDVATDPVTGTPVPVIEPLDRATFESNRPARTALVDAFVAQRLLTAEGDKNAARVRPVHEALLRIWPEAVSIIAENASLIRVRHILEPIVQGWKTAEQKDKARHLDISPALLDGALELAIRFGDDLPKAMTTFINQSSAADAARRNRERRRQRRVLGATLAALIVVAGLAGAAVLEGLAAQSQRDRANNALTLARSTANGLLLDLAGDFANAVGAQKSIIKDIIDRALKLENDLIVSGETDPRLLIQQALGLQDKSDVQRDIGEMAGSLASAQQSNELMSRLVATNPKNVAWQFYLAASFEKIGEAKMRAADFTGAQAAYEEALKIYRRLAADPSAGKNGPAADAPRKVAEDLAELGKVKFLKNDPKGAQADYEESLSKLREIAKSDSSEVLKRDLALILERVGSLKRGAAALADYEEALPLLRDLAKGENKVLARRDLVQILCSIGGLKLDAGDTAGAQAAYEEALPIARDQAKDESHSGVQLDVARVLIGIADVDVRKNEPSHRQAARQAYSEAIAYLRKAAVNASDVPVRLQLAAALLQSVQAEDNPEVIDREFSEGLSIMENLASEGRAPPQLKAALPMLQARLGEIKIQVGDSRVKKGDLMGAVDSYRTSLTLLETSIAALNALIAKDANNTELKNSLQMAVGTIGGLAFDLVLVQDFSDAFAAADGAIAVAPDKIWLYANRAHALMFTPGREDEARALYLKYRGEKDVQGGKSWEALVLQDFAAMRNTGLPQPPLMEEIEKLFAGNTQ
jgi:tetratricopeptide (TPR) repeat protein